MLPGTVIAALSLPRLTTVPPAGATAPNVTVQLSEPAPVYALVTQFSELNTGAVLD